MKNYTLAQFYNDTNERLANFPHKRVDVIFRCEKIDDKPKISFEILVSTTNDKMIWAPGETPVIALLELEKRILEKLHEAEQKQLNLTTE